MAHSKDFFISYNKANRAWAEWIAWVLEAEGYRTVVQDWDFKPGGNFVVEMDTATKECARTIAVLSQDYLDAEFTVPEWAAQFATDPKGLNRRLVPVRVDSCDIEGLLGQVIYCDLVGLDEEASRKRLLSQLSPGRTKPAVAPPFPGASRHTLPIPKQPSSSSKRALWRPLAKPIHPQWRGDTMHGGYRDRRLSCTASQSINRPSGSVTTGVGQRPASTRSTKRVVRPNGSCRSWCSRGPC